MSTVPQNPPGKAGTQNRPKPLAHTSLTAGIRSPEGLVFKAGRSPVCLHSSNALNVLPLMRRLFELEAGRTPPCCLKCVCCLTSSNVGNRSPGVCIASTMQFFMHAHSSFVFGICSMCRDLWCGNNPVRIMIVIDLRPRPGTSTKS